MPNHKPRTSNRVKHPVTIHAVVPVITREQLPGGKYRYRQDGQVHTSKSTRLYTHASAYRTSVASANRRAGVTRKLAVGDAVVFLHTRADIAAKGSVDANRIPTLVPIPGAIEITEYNPTTTKKEGTMPRKPKTSTTTKATEAKATSNGKAPAFTLTKKDATALAKRLRSGETMKSIREEYGHSDGSKVRAALRAHGFGSKGQDNPDGLTPTEWRAKHGEAPATKKKAAPKTKAKPEPEEEPEAEEEEDEGAPAAKLTDAERKAKRAEYRRNRRAAKKAEAEGTAAPATRKRTRKPKAAAANPS